MTQKIQYFMPDLARALKLGKIIQIHIAEDNGQTVLRIECEPAGEYKTVKAEKQRQSAPKKSAKRSRDSDKEETLLDKGMSMAKNWWNKPGKPPWEHKFPRS